MKAVLLKTPGAPEALEYTEVPTPEPGPGEVLVRAHRMFDAGEVMGKLLLKP